MQNNTHDIVSSTFLEIVEQLTFMFGEPENKAELPLSGYDYTLASMSFGGDLAGTIAVAVPTEITAEIAANILGLDVEDIDSEDMRNDAVAEMLNVVCGHVIMAMVGTDANFKLNSPHTESLAADARDALIDDDNFVGFILEDSPVLLGLKLES